MRERFRDGAAILADYSFDINHKEEDGNEQRRNITRTANTANVGFVRQQGDKSPVVLKFLGTIMKQDQKDKMESFYAACDNRTIFFRDYTGVEYEVLITTFDTTRKSTIKNGRDPSIMHYWTYRLEMEVI